MSKLLSTKKLIKSVRSLIQEAQKSVIRNVNSVMLITYYEIGRRIIEEEQEGKERANYGFELLKYLSEELFKEFGRGYSVDNLQNMRKLYFEYSKYETVSRISKDFFQLSWSHYIQLMKIENEEERRFYELEAIQNNWSLRELKRQYLSSLYERLPNTRNSEGVNAFSNTGQIIDRPFDVFKNPYILEFLNLNEATKYSENDLEAAIINKLEHFMLELGKGFLFEGRQRRFTIDGQHFFVDLVFYNRLLKCFVLFDLKIGELTHQDIGQMQMYRVLRSLLYKHLLYGFVNKAYNNFPCRLSNERSSMLIFMIVRLN